MDCNTITYHRNFLSEFSFNPYKGLINGRIIIELVFIIVLQTIELIIRNLNYDPLRKKKNNQKFYRETIKEKSIDLTRIF